MTHRTSPTQQPGPGQRRHRNSNHSTDQSIPSRHFPPTQRYHGRAQIPTQLSATRYTPATETAAPRSQTWRCDTTVVHPHQGFGNTQGAMTSFSPFMASSPAAAAVPDQITRRMANTWTPPREPAAMRKFSLATRPKHLGKKQQKRQEKTSNPEIPSTPQDTLKKTGNVVKGSELPNKKQFGREEPGSQDIDKQILAPAELTHAAQSKAVPASAPKQVQPGDVAVDAADYTQIASVDSQYHNEKGEDKGAGNPEEDDIVVITGGTESENNGTSGCWWGWR